VATSLRPLGVLILSLLAERDMHPYEMMRTMRVRRDDRLVKLQNGTFYHQVSSLERAGYIAEVGIDRDGNRPERTTYTLLPSGTEAVQHWVRSRLADAERSDQFTVALSEAHFLPRDEVIALLEARIAALRIVHDTAREAIDDVYRRDVDPQFVIHVERDIALVSADIAWTQDCCRRLADAAFAWGEPSERHLAAKRQQAQTHRKDDA